MGLLAGGDAIRVRGRLSRPFGGGGGTTADRAAAATSAVRQGSVQLIGGCRAVREGVEHAPAPAAEVELVELVARPGAEAGADLAEPEGRRGVG
ncbi:hypothetical protein ACRAWC_13685 [Leifsonia sp. L25]|uniref:hypothetical protein n=1 Tax=Actinomycetes TaxID=1760 RepID=UPI003D68B7B8